MAISSQFKDELRARVRISDAIIRSGVALKKNGREWKACCPFHQEKTPSFTVNDEKGFYHCFGCQAHGDVISWKVDHDNMGFIDAVKELAEQAGLEMPQQDPHQAERERERGIMLDINASVAAMYHRELKQSDKARSYLLERGISEETAVHFEVGYAKFSKASALLEAWPKGHKRLDALGLVRDRDDGSSFDFFRDRLMIPIHDTRGKVIGFGGRILGKGEPKYLNSPDTPVFDKGRTLFNAHRAASPARKAKRLIVVEGYMDVIGLHGVGITESVAPNGTALTEDQMRLAWRMCEAPIVFMDGDRAGRAAAAKAAIRALPILEPGKSLKFVFPPEGQDPDDMARAGGIEAIEALIENPATLISVIWDDLTSRFDINDPDQKAKLTSEARQLVNSIKNRDVYAAYTQHFRQLLGVSRPKAQDRHQNPSSPRLGSKTAFEDMLILSLLKTPAVFWSSYEQIAKIQWQDAKTKELVEDIIDLVLDKVETAETLHETLRRQQLYGQIEHISARSALNVPDLDQNSLLKMVNETIASQRKSK